MLARERGGGMATGLKLFLTGSLVVVSLVSAILRGYAWHWLLFAGLFVSFFADAMLAEYPPVARKVRDPFVAGMGLFSVVQVLYCAAFWKSIVGMPALYMRKPGAILGMDFVGSLLPVYLLFGVLFWVLVVFRSQKPLEFKVAVLLYAELLSAMAALACAAAFAGIVFAWPLILGGTLFMVSDALIALNLFQDRFPDRVRYERAVWATYFPAQLLLCLGASWLY